jgi:hypothetical protein
MSIRQARLASLPLAAKRLGDFVREWWSSPVETQSATGEELRPFFGRTLLPSRRDASQSVLRPAGRAFKGEL